MVLFLDSEGAAGNIDMIARQLVDGIVLAALLKRRLYTDRFRIAS